jgi:hypothetical protein
LVIYPLRLDLPTRSARIGAREVAMIGSLDLAAALLLMAAGFGKVLAPHAAAVMLRRAVPVLRRPTLGRATVRVSGLAEVAIAGAVIGDGGRLALGLLAAAYLAFAGVALRLLALPDGTACGCFGRSDAPVGVLHVAVDLAAAAVATAGAAEPPGSVGGFGDDGALTAVTGFGQAVLVAYLAYLSITVLPAVSAERRKVTV